MGGTNIVYDFDYHYVIVLCPVDYQYIIGANIVYEVDYQSDASSPGPPLYKKQRGLGQTHNTEHRTQNTGDRSHRVRDTRSKQDI